jgi:hypothetical protein
MARSFTEFPEFPESSPQQFNQRVTSPSALAGRFCLHLPEALLLTLRSLRDAFFSESDPNLDYGCESVEDSSEP